MEKAAECHGAQVGGLPDVRIAQCEERLDVPSIGSEDVLDAFDLLVRADRIGRDVLRGDAPDELRPHEEPGIGQSRRFAIRCAHRMQELHVAEVGAHQQRRIPCTEGFARGCPLLSGSKAPAGVEIMKRARARARRRSCAQAQGEHRHTAPQCAAQ
ncbi:MAG: hypothetical protein QM586_00940 [Xenophilus sp.]